MARTTSILFILILCSIFARSQQTKSLNSENYFTVRSGIPHFYHGVFQKKKATVVYLGGSITNGSGWRDIVDSFLTSKFPWANFHFINAGIPSLGSNAHAFRLNQDVLDSGSVDLLFLEAAVNDNGTDSATQVRSLEGIVRHLKRVNPHTDIILMSFVDPGKIENYNNHKVPVEVSNHELVAGHYQLPSINFAKEIRDRINKKEFDWKHDFVDLHPSSFGHRLYFHSIQKLLDTCLIKFMHDRKLVKQFIVPVPLDRFNFENGTYSYAKDIPHNEDWILSKDWTPHDSLPVRKGYVHTPILTGSKPGSDLSIPFKGNAIGIAIVSGPDAGKLLWSVDKRLSGEVDLFTPFSTQLHLPVYTLLAEGLDWSSHVLTLRISESKNSKSTGHECDIIYSLVNPPF